MHYRLSPRFCAPLVVVAAGLLLAAAAPAFARRQSAPPPAETMKQAVTQANGITDRVIDKLWVKTDAYWHEGDYQRIVALIRVCVAADPSFTEAYSSGAWLLWSMGDTEGADALLEDGEKHSPNRAQIDHEFGGQMFRTKRYDKAAQYLKRATDSGTVFVTAYTTYAHSLEKLGRYGEAVTVWQTIIKKFPHFVAGPHNLQRAMAMRDGTYKPPVTRSTGTPAR